MNINKKEILEKICYTELVYGRIRKKLNISLTNDEIEKLIYDAIDETPEDQFEKVGKNYYIKNHNRGFCLTINSFTTRIITVDRIGA